MHFSWSNFCALSVILLVHGACEGERSQQTPPPPMETGLPENQSESSRNTSDSHDSNTEPAPPLAPADTKTVDEQASSEQESDQSTVIQDSTPTTTTTPVPVPTATPAPTPEPAPEPTETPVPRPTETPAPPELDVIEEIENDLGKAIADAEAQLKFQKEFTARLEPWEADLRKAVALLNGYFYQTVKTYRIPELIKRRDELTAFVNESPIDEKNKDNARAIILSRYQSFADVYAVRGSATREFTNLANAELKRLNALCMKHPETALSCSTIQKLAAVKRSFFGFKDWSESSFLIFETLIFDLGKAPLNEEQALTAEKFYQALQDAQSQSDEI